MILREVLAKIKRPLCSLPGDRPVDAAIRLMARHKTTALAVTEAGRPVGIFTASDIVRSYAESGATDFRRIVLKDAMTPEPITGHPEDHVASAATRMTQGGIRHLPVVSEERLFGILTVSDLMEHQSALLEGELKDLKEYIAHLHDAAHD
jgi:CBS domain-containing protein